MKREGKNTLKECETGQGCRESREGRSRNLNVNYPLIVSIVVSILYLVDLPLNAFTFHFVHANVFHLCGNLVALSVIFIRHPSLPHPVASLLVAYWCCSMFWFLTTNVGGFSSIIFFLWGLRFPLDYKNLANRPGTRKRYVFGITLTFIASALIPSLTFALHFLPFVAGVLGYFLYRVVGNYVGDMEYLENENQRF